MISAPAYAKINLFLYITGKRDDGFHNIFSLMQKISLCDIISIEAAQKFSLECHNIPIKGKNIIEKAWETLCTYFGVTYGCRVVLEKNIPHGSGLGGGSSDAAKFIELFLEHFELSCSDAQKIELGAHIGSDVPFFFCKGAALVEGRGEVFRAIDCAQDYYVVLLCPRFSISTPWAYANVKKFLTVPENFRNFDTCADSNSFWSLLESFENNFEHVAFAHYDEYAGFRVALLAAGAKKVLLSGSGSSIFGVFESETCAQEAMKLKLDCEKFLVHPVNSN